MINLYYHGGSSNHGCEAIVRSTKKIIGEPLNLYSTDTRADKTYKLDELVTLYEDRHTPLSKLTPEYFFSAVWHKLTKTDYLHIKYARASFFSKVKPEDVYLSIGGDNYCYGGRDILGYYNRIIQEKGGKTVLWGCSVEPKDIGEMEKKDLARYNLITARESISYQALCQINSNTFLLPDPAFLLDTVNLPLPEGFWERKTVGINISPLIIASENKPGITMENYRVLIENIIDHTDMQIALIPHVVQQGSDDRIPLKALYEMFLHTGRVVMIEDCNAMELKGYISRCAYFVGARTHATIAAYSSCVPTLVVGYSVKARGIASDIFGTTENYVLPVQSLSANDQLLYKFRWLQEHRQQVVDHLNWVIPGYCQRAMKAGELVRGLMK